MYGEDIEPRRMYKTMRAIRATRQHVVQTHNPSSIQPGQMLQIRFPNIGPNDVIVPGSFVVSGALKITSAKDPKRTVVPNIGRKIVKTLKVYFKGNEVLSINNYDEIMTYFDLWLSKKAKSWRIPQGIQTAKGLALRVGAKDATGDIEKIAIAKTLGDRFQIPIDFELLNNVGPFHQHSLADKLEIQLTFNDPKSIVLGSTATLAAAPDADYNYSMVDIKTEWDQITDFNPAHRMASKYQKFALPFTRIIQHHFTVIKKSDTVVNLNVNVPSKSLSHILILAIDSAEDRKPFDRKEVFKNLDLTKVNVTIEGSPNQLYAQGILRNNTWDQIVKLFHENGVSMGEFLTKKYALCLDLRPSIDARMHGNGVELKNTTNGIIIELHRVAGSSTENLNLYVFLLQDAQLNIEDGRYHIVEL